MTDTSDSDTTEQPNDEPSVAQQLTALQEIDTQSDQLKVKRERLDERDRFITTSGQLAEWERQRAKYRARLETLDASIEEAEAEGVTTLAERDRLEAQMKTVIAPREAEALMHEIATINQRRDELDDVELAALEEQSTIDDQLTQHLTGEAALRDAVSAADAALGRACADIDNELAGLASSREAAAAVLTPFVLARYEAVRAANGVAVAALRGAQCTGCHLDLSAAEIDTAKDEASDAGHTDCPQCGRMLIV